MSAHLQGPERALRGTHRPLLLPGHLGFLWKSFSLPEAHLESQRFYEGIPLLLWGEVASVEPQSPLAPCIFHSRYFTHHALLGLSSRAAAHCLTHLCTPAQARRVSNTQGVVQSERRLSAPQRCLYEGPAWRYQARN